MSIPNPSCPRCGIPMERTFNGALRCGLSAAMHVEDIYDRAAVRKTFGESGAVFSYLFPERFQSYPLSGGSTASPVLQQPPAPQEP